MRLMLAQTAPRWGDVPANLVALEALCRQASAAGADLLALPELALSGYNVFARLDEFAEPEGGPIARRLAELAAEHGLFLVVGLAQRQADGRLTNTAVLIDDHGERLATYHKRQLWDREHAVFAAGDDVCVVDTRLGRLGLMICYDNEFPEMARALARGGAEIILSPTANMMPNAGRQVLQIRARALDNQCFVACINRAGAEAELHYCGNSLIAGPDGEILGQLGAGAGSLMVDLDRGRIAESRALQDYLKDLRPTPEVTS